LLKNLTIKNYALIEHLETGFYPGFSVMTGETGAGKSIILGALGLILGQRADLQSLMNKQEKCIVEGVFGIERRELQSFFADNNLDYDPDQAILRREILPSGKSRAFINDTPVNLNTLKELAELLVDIHSQNKVTQIQDVEFQLASLDSFAGLEKQLAHYRENYHHLASKKQQLKTLIGNEAKAAQEQDFNRFQYEELEAAQLRAGEQEEIEEELQLLTHAEEIKQRLTNADQAFNSEQGLIDAMNDLLSELRPVKSYYSDIGSVYNAIESAFLEIKEAAVDIEKVNEKLDVDPERAGVLSERINLLYNLQQKHRVDNVAELLRVKEDYAAKIADYSSMKDHINALTAEVEKMEKDVAGEAALISEKRKAAISDFARRVMLLTDELGMPNARFSVDVKPLTGLTTNGCDEIVFLFNANKGGELQEMARVASGGELSRLLLAVKAINATRKMISTIIFDEIDSGVSGEIAGKMGSIMQGMSSGMQVVSITHLPQIAARGHYHYVVYKEPGDELTKTFIRELDQEERIAEIAKMLSDTRVTASALDTARELLKN
jgi:DNA repair protein RecN (Recombination protein N)